MYFTTNVVTTFAQFVRRIIRHSLEYMAEGNWDEEEVGIYSDMLSDTIINANKNMAALEVPVGLQTHVTMLFPEELAKVGCFQLLPFVSIALTVMFYYRQEEKRVYHPQSFSKCWNHLRNA